MAEKADFDVIGDVHGCASELKALLRKLGYRKAGAKHQRCWRHPRRKAVFLGDFINRGPRIAKTLKIVRRMVEGGAAYAVLGNNELDALVADAGGFAHDQPDLAETDRQIGLDSEKWKASLAWFRTLPLWLELQDSQSHPRRFVHACWSDAHVGKLLAARCWDGSSFLEGPASAPRLSRWALSEMVLAESRPAALLWELINGPVLEVGFPLPPWSSGQKRTSVRLRWYLDGHGRSLAEMIFSRPKTIAKFLREAPANACADWTAVPVPHLTFIGHYRINGCPVAPLTDHLACLDFGAVVGGELAAYRCRDGETVLDPAHFVAVECPKMLERRRREKAARVRKASEASAA